MCRSSCFLLVIIKHKTVINSTTTLEVISSVNALILPFIRGLPRMHLLSLFVATVYAASGLGPYDGINSVSSTSITTRQQPPSAPRRGFRYQQHRRSPIIAWLSTSTNLRWNTSLASDMRKCNETHRHTCRSLPSSAVRSKRLLTVTESYHLQQQHTRNVL